MRASSSRAWRVGLAASLAAAGLVASGCSGPRTPSEGSSPIGGGSGGAGTPVAPTPAKPIPPPTPAGARLAECVVDTWRLRTISSTPGGSVEQVEFSGRGAFDLVFSDTGRWRLVGRRDTPLTATFEVAGYPVTGTAKVEGTATGGYRLVDTVGVFRLEKTSGQVDMRWPTGEQTYGMDTLARALVPDGTAALRCSADRLRLKAENVTLSLARR